jgi:hypothetical protein
MGSGNMELTRMSKRKYDGTPIDLTWNTGPWANDGETVDATDTKNGEIKTTMETKNAPKLTEHNRREVAKYVRKNLLNGVTPSELERQSPYSRATITRAANGKGAWNKVECSIPPLRHEGSPRQGEWVIQTDVDKINKAQNQKAKGKDRKFTESGVADVRKKLLQGVSLSQLADKYGGSKRTVGVAARGEETYRNIDCEIAPLEYIGNEWVKESQNEERCEESDGNEKSTPIDTATTTYHPPERDSNRRLAYGVALVALVSYALGKLRGGDE